MALVDLPEKPAYHAPICNGCGVCCMATACPLAVQYLGEAAGQACSILEWADGRFWCGLLRSPNRHLAELAPPARERLESNIRRAIGVVGLCDCDAPAGLTVLSLYDPEVPF